MASTVHWKHSSKSFAHQFWCAFEMIVLLECDIAPIIPAISYDLLQISVQHYIIQFNIHTLNYLEVLYNTISCHTTPDHDRLTIILDHGLDKLRFQDWYQSFSFQRATTIANAMCSNLVVPNDAMLAFCHQILVFYCRFKMGFHALVC
jgi:hypothetical protein